MLLMVPIPHQNMYLASIAYFLCTLLVINAAYFQASVEKRHSNGSVRTLGELFPDDLYGEEMFVEVSERCFYLLCLCSCR